MDDPCANTKFLIPSLNYAVLFLNLLLKIYTLTLIRKPFRTEIEIRYQLRNFTSCFEWKFKYEGKYFILK